MEPPSDGALRVKGMIDLLKTAESGVGSPEALAELVRKLVKEAVKRCVKWSLANRSTEAKLAEVLDDPCAQELEDQLIGA